MIDRCGACSWRRRPAATAGCSIDRRWRSDSTHRPPCACCCAPALAVCTSRSTKPVAEAGMLWLCILLPPLEPAALRNLALWALQWSSQVSPCANAAGAAGGAALWIEIGASRQLLGSAGALRERIGSGLDELGYRGSLGIAPTPQGAALLARARAGADASVN